MKSIHLVTLTCGASLLVGVSLAAGAQLELVSLVRTAAAEQTTSAPAAASTYVFTAVAFFNDTMPPDIAAELRTPQGDVPLYTNGPDSLYFSAGLPTLAELDDTFRSGNYRFVFTSGISGTYTMRLNLTPPPAPPHISNFDAAQGIERDTPFTLRWDPIPGATTNDTILISIENVGGFAHDIPELPGTATELTMTLGTAPYSGSITIVRTVQEFDLNNNVQGVILLAGTTLFPLHVYADLPVFEEEPLDFRVAENGEAFFKARLLGGTQPDGGVKWQRKMAGTAEWSNLTGDSNTNYEYQESRMTLHVKGIHPTFYGDEFRCVATATGRSAYTRAASLVRAPEHVITDIAGQRGQQGFEDGTGAQARFFAMGSAVRDFAGNAYVSEHNVIRKVTAAGVVTTLAGSRGYGGILDGTGGAAGFSSLGALARGSDGNMYALDGTTIRCITPEGVVTTLAGQPEASGLVDGQGAAARFAASGHLAADARGNLYVTDLVNLVIRKVTLAGVVTTIAGSPGPSAYVDGIGSNARFMTMLGLAAAPDGTLYVTDNWNNVIRRVSPAAEVTTVAIEGGSFQWLVAPTKIAVDGMGNLLVVDGAHLKRIAPDGRITMVIVRRGDGSTGSPDFCDFSSLAPEPDGGVLFAEGTTVRLRRVAPVNGISFAATPVGVVIGVDQEVVLTATAVGGGGLPITYQWRRNGVDIPGATGATYTIPSAQAFDAGTYSVIASTGQLFAESASAQVQVAPAAASADTRLLNLSTRARAETGDGLLIPGFVIQGTGTKRLLIRGVGPTLEAFGVGDRLANPRISLRQVAGSSSVELVNNDDWGSQPNAATIATVTSELNAFALPADSLDAVLLVDLKPGTYTVLANDTAGDTGIAIVELYDADPAAPGTRLVNISNRGFVGVGENVMIPGFVVSPEGPRTFLIRAVGPGLAGFGVAGTLANPQLDVFRQVADRDPEWILGNDNWGDNAGASTTAAVALQTGAFPLAHDSADAAFVVTLSPGAYTAQASGVGGTSGIALVEIYLVP